MKLLKITYPRFPFINNEGACVVKNKNYKCIKFKKEKHVIGYVFVFIASLLNVFKILWEWLSVWLHGTKNYDSMNFGF